MLPELRDQIQILKKNKAPGDDNITAEMIKICSRGNDRSNISTD
jgi:hypothetical protein